MAPRRCEFCLVHDTTATLTDGTAICWRPCYAALTYVKAGMPADRALLQAFEDVPYGVALMREMNESGLEVVGLHDRLLGRAFGLTISHVRRLTSGSAA